jgi:transketolase
MTHDSIGLGEDGPTHQPVEHLMSLRMIPNLAVFRPADAVETAECWALALERSGGPSLLALSRQNLSQLRTERADNLCARGAYRLRSAKAARQVVLIATGSEVELAVSVADRLEGEGIGADVVSMPCWSLFDAQGQDYRDEILPKETLRISIEAGVTLGWERYVGPRGLAIGLDRFGASAPAEDLFQRFGFTAEAIVPQIDAALAIQGDQ